MIWPFHRKSSVWTRFPLKTHSCRGAGWLFWRFWFINTELNLDSFILLLPPAVGCKKRKSDRDIILGGQQEGGDLSQFTAQGYQWAPINKRGTLCTFWALKEVFRAIFRADICLWGLKDSSAVCRRVADILPPKPLSRLVRGKGCRKDGEYHPAGSETPLVCWLLCGMCCPDGKTISIKKRQNQSDKHRKCRGVSGLSALTQQN